MKGYVYILECANGKYYTGSTNNLARRLEEHELGLGANFTRKFLPVRLIFIEEHPRIDLAFKREKQIQGWSRKKKENLISSNYQNLRLLAECQNESHANSVLSHPPNLNPDTEK